jgi:repressor LexA
MTDFGLRLRTKRKQRGLTQQQLAELLGIRQSVIAQLEKGHKGDVGASRVVELTQLLHCSADYLLGLAEDNNEEHMA